MIPLAFLSRFGIKDYIIAALLIALTSTVVFIHFKNNKIDNLNVQVAQVKVDLVVCRQNKIVLEQAIKDQNQRIEQMKKDSEANQTSMQVLNDSLAKQRRETQKTIEAILSRPVPKDCDGAMRDLYEWAQDWASTFNGETKP